MYYFIVSMDQKFGSGLSRWLGGVPHKIAVRMLAGAAVIWRFDWGGRVTFLRWLKHLAGKLVLAVYRRPQLLIMWASPLGYMTWLLTSLRVIDPEKSKSEAGLEVIHHHFHLTLLVIQTNLDRIWEGTTQRYGSLGSILEAVYHNTVIKKSSKSWNIKSGKIT